MLAAADFLAYSWIQALGWALLHFFWQGALIAVVAAGLMAVPTCRTPRVRHALGLLALLAMLMAPIGTMWAVYGPEVSPLPLTSADITEAGHADVVAQEPMMATELPTETPVTPPNLTHSTPPRSFEPVTPPRSLRSKSASYWQVQRARMAPYVPWAVLLWLAGVLLFAVRNTASWLLVRQMRTHGVSPVPEHVLVTLEALRRRLGIGRVVACLQSSRMSVPCTMGWLKPVILLPASSLLGLDAVQLEAVLAHELAHIRRYDYLANLFQTLAETILFYHPAVWWLSSRIRLERELCCDDLVVQTCADPVAYAEALVRVATLRRDPELALAATGGDLLHRIRRLAQPMPVRPPRFANVAISLTIALLASAAMLGPSLPVLWAQATNAAPGARTINFPEWTMGQVMVRPWGSDRDTEWQPFQPAMGAVAVPEGMEVQLVVDNSAVTDLSPLGYLGAQDLQSINFRRTEVQDDQLAYIEGLELNDLNFELTEISNEALQYIDDMTSLESLSVGRTNVNNEGIPYLSGLTGLRQLDLNLTGVNDDGLASLANLRDLAYLDLWNSEITDGSLQWIGTLEQLQVLGLEGARISDEGLAALAQLHNLEHLVIENTPVSDEGLALLQGLQNLARINLTGTRVTDASADILQNFPSLRQVAIPVHVSHEFIRNLDGVEFSGTKHLDGQAFEVTVVEKGTGDPVPGAHIEVKPRRSQHVSYFPANLWANEAGRAPFQFVHVREADVTVYAAGYTPKTVPWDMGENNRTTVTLERTQPIGGFVVNEEGDPVADVTLELSIPGKRNYRNDSIGQHTESSLEDGTWQCAHVPANLSSLILTLAHPEYAPTSYESGQLAAAQLKAGKQVLVIRRGLDVTGSVVDPEGNAVPGASIAELVRGRFEFNFTSTNRTQTDANGNFRLANQNPGTMRLKINAGGYRPEVQEVHIENDSEPLQFTLNPGGILQGKIVNQEGIPIEGVLLETTGVPGSIYVDHQMISWKSATDADGRFYWDEAPEEPVSLQFRKDGYAHLVNELTASAEEIVVVMNEEYRPIRLAGRVLDAESGEPVPDFKIEVQYGPRKAHFSRIKASSDGSYAMDSRDYGPEFTLTVETDGYFFQTSPTFRMADGDVSYDFNLERAPQKTGVLRTPDGALAVGAQYVLATPFTFEKHAKIGGTVECRDGAIDTRRNDRVKETGDDGRYAVSILESPSVLFATHEAGFVRVNVEELEDEADLSLRPWARVEGIVKIGNEPAPNARLSFQLERRETPTFSIDSYSTNTDEFGRFSVARVFPGHAWLRRMLPSSESGRLDFIIAKFIEVPEGETVQVALGGTGRPVQGTVIIPDGLKGRLALDHGSSGRITERYPISWPADSDSWTEEEKIKWKSAWLQSDEGKKAIRHQNGYGFFLDEDGHFLIDDVEAGPYELSIRLIEYVEGKRIYEFPLVGTVEYEFDVPEMEGGRSDDPLNLGTVSMKPL